MKKEIDNIVNWVKSYPGKSYVIGLSGGVDSSAVCGIAVESVGVDNVFGIIMPSINHHGDDVKDAISVAKHYGINYHIHSIRDMYNMVLLDTDHGMRLCDITKGNIQARLRMTILRMYAELFGSLVIGTTNKSEDLLGYFTKGGDGGSGVDIEPLADYYKSEIIEIAKYFKLPDNLVNRTPSAGLWDNQTDEEELGFTYDDFENYWKWKSNEIGKNPVSNTITDKIIHLHKITEHKRNTPPKYERK